MNNLILNFDPFFSVYIIFIYIIIALIFIIYSFMNKYSGSSFRSLTLLFLLFLMLNPSIMKKDIKPIKDIVLVVNDLSDSQLVLKKDIESNNAVKIINSKLKKIENLEVRNIVVNTDLDINNNEGTNILTAINDNLSDVQSKLISAIIVVTDGQIHDTASFKNSYLNVPIHFILTGNENELDRRLVIDEVPKYGIIGKEININLKVEDLGFNGEAMVEISIDNEKSFKRSVRTNENIPIKFPLEHAGETTLEIKVEKGPHELIEENNLKTIKINGIHDRLRVMLISGEPNMGLRSWRNLLNSDPAIELIHFTILRPPNKRDLTPVRELSLIPFPSRELFAANLDEFDLIIFDQYSLRGILPPKYLNNIVNYVYNGGALLDASGPSYASQFSLSNSPLKSILPTIPTGKIVNEPFTPLISSSGTKHPVTSELNEYLSTNSWGDWYRYIDTIQIAGETLLETKNKNPLLILNKIGEGRVAQLLSDHSWLWVKSVNQLGPQSKLLRRTIHWLLKEPELDEDAFLTSISENKINIVKNSLTQNSVEANILKPDGKTERITLKDSIPGKLTGSININYNGKYEITLDGNKKTIFIGSINNLEMEDVRSTIIPLEPIASKSNGSIFWIKDGIPEIIGVSKLLKKPGKKLIGIESKNNTIIEDIKKSNLLNWYTSMLILISLIFLSWYRESK